MTTKNDIDYFNEKLEQQKEYTNLLNQKLSGSGFDCNWIDSTIYKNGKFDIIQSFHVMNENGFYDGYIDFTVRFTNDTDIFKVYLNGKHSHNLERKYQVKDYIEDCIYNCLCN